jgi:inosine-uridine nucleoside N-ribohydrolase
VPIFIDSDNALGSPRGDVDDAYAIAALLAASAPVVGIGACDGNTSAELAYANNLRLAARFGFTGPVLRADESRVFLRDFPGRVLALGPLTNVVDARRASEIVIVGGNASTRGRWPPAWPHEFNLTHDRAAALAVFALDVPLTVFPLDVARRLWITVEQVPPLFREESRRWFRYLRFVRFTGRFPIYDLAATLYALDERGFTFADTTAVMRPNTFLELGKGGRRVKLCTGLDREALWRRFLALSFPGGGNA